MNSSKFKIVSRAIALSTLVAGFSACGGGGGGDPAPAPGPTALTSVDGTWKSECRTTADPAVFATFEFTALGGSSTETTRLFDDAACTAQASVEAILTTYTLGSAVTVNGSVEGITTATRFDHTDGGLKTTFDLVAIKGSTLFLGNTDAAATDGTTDAKRATQLDPAEKFINASAALTSINGTWKSACRLDVVTFEVITLVATNGTGSIEVKPFALQDCVAQNGPATITQITYTLGSAVSVDGSVEGITIATKLDVSDGVNTQFDLVAIKGDSLFTGKLDAATDGSTAAKRPGQLDIAKKSTRQ